MRKQKRIRWIPFIQGMYLLMTAFWPLLHIESFISLTGHKTDLWLVKTVSVLLFPLAIIVLSACKPSKQVSMYHATVVITGTAGLAMVELYYYFNGTITWLYLADAMIQLFFMIWWIAAFYRHFDQLRRR